MTEKRFGYVSEELCYGVTDNGKFLSPIDCMHLLNEQYEENEKFKDMAISLMRAYKNLRDETDGLVLGDAMRERIYALTDLLNNLGLHDLIKENGVDKLE